MEQPPRAPDRPPADSAAALTIVIVTYNTRELVCQCLESLAEVEAEVFVVDNVSHDGTAAAARAARPEAVVVENAENAGFARANNQALRAARGRHLCLLNPDTRVPAGALEALQQALDQDPRLGIVGPRLINPDGSFQSAGLSFPTPGSLAAAAIPWAQPTRGAGQLPAAPGEARPCDWIIGACMMIRREVLEQVGLLDEGYFMYGEEKDLCYRARQAGWQVACLPGVDVVHYGGQSADQVPEMAYLAFLDSQLYFLRKFYPARYGRLFAAATWTGCRLRQVGGALLGVVRPGRRPVWWGKSRTAGAGARRCAEYLWRKR